MRTSQKQKKEKTGATGLGRIITRADRTVQSNHSHEIPDRRKTSEVPGLPSGLVWRGFGESDVD